MNKTQPTVGRWCGKSMFQPTVISEDVLAAHCTILIRGNTKLKDCAELAGMEHKEFRGKLFKAEMSPEKMFLPTKVVLAVHKAVPDIKAVKALEWTIFTGFIRVAWKLARRVSRWGSLEMDDAEQEAYAALIDAIYGYSKPSTKFHSFAWNVIIRRLWAAHNKNNPMSPLTNQAIELMTAYEAEKQFLNCTGPVTPEQVMDSLEMPEEDRAVVRDCLSIQVCDGSSLSNRGGDGDPDDSLDYTGFRRGIDMERNTVSCNFEVRDALDRAELTDLERSVVDASMESYHGWLTDMAERTINQATGRPYTKKGISVILDRALEKIRLAYDDEDEGQHRIAV